MLAASIGQNAVVTGDRLRGGVGRIEAFYPLPFGNRAQNVAGSFSSIYLFGTVQMQLGGNSKSLPSLVLNTSSVPAYDSSVTLIPVYNSRDVYRIGFGVDLVSLASQLTTGSSKNSTTNAAAPKTPASGTGAATSGATP
jgi:hypothetical protein